ncbi:MAG: histidine phosphatase family protein [Phormidesmis sp.]
MKILPRSRDLLSQETITLIRHGPPAVSILQRVQGHQFRQFIERYDAAKICRRAQPPRLVQQVVAGGDVVLTSHRPRAMHTAELLGASTLVTIDPRFREIEFPVDFPTRFPKRFQFSALTWTVMALALWRLGYGTRCESFAIAQQRAYAAVDLLEHQLKQPSTERPLVEGPPGHWAQEPDLSGEIFIEPVKPRSIVLVAHGGINKLIAKELRLRGWRGPRLPRSRHWGCTTYCR